MAQENTEGKKRNKKSRTYGVRLSIADLLSYALSRRGITTFVRSPKKIFGEPDISFPVRKIAVFCDGDYWHGYDWEHAQKRFEGNREYWINRIEKTIQRDRIVTSTLRAEGWTVFRFWGHEIKNEVDRCVDVILEELRVVSAPPYRTIDLCAGIGGIRRGFELTGQFHNVLAAENDFYARKTYQHLFGEDPDNDLTSKEFKEKACNTEYDFLLAGFPCQSFSRVGHQEGFNNEEKGKIFFHIAEIIRRTRPIGFFLENVERLVTHDGGRTFSTIATILVSRLGYHVIGIEKDVNGELVYSAKDIIRNSKDFGVPQNRPRTYLIGFDTERFSNEKLNELPHELPKDRKRKLYEDLNDLLETDVPEKYYLASGYLDTLMRHRERQEKRGYGFGYRIVNEKGIEHPVANTLLATGGSGRERNLIYDPREGIAGLKIEGKKSPLNDRGIRVMTPTEWGKLQGFINYAFVDKQGNDFFGFPDDIPDVQKYKQFGNTVTIPVVERMAEFILQCLDILQPTSGTR